MKLTITTILALSAFVTPSFALTLDQAYDELAGMNCSGSECTSSTTSSATVDNPDIVTSTTTELSPEVSGHDNDPFSTAYGCWTTTMDHKTIRATNVSRDCVPNSIGYVGGGRGAVVRVDTTVTDGGTTTVYSCDTTVKTLSYNGPYTSRDGAWSVDSSTSSSDGAC